MLRKYFLEWQQSRRDSDSLFRLRGQDVGRIEGFSDGVFGFTITLVALSLETPKTFDALMAAFRGFGAFTLCFWLLYSIWHTHYTFFRRFGLQDEIIVRLNATLLFIVLLFIYPMKFLVSYTTGIIVERLSVVQIHILFLFYGGGMSLLYLCFLLMYLQAYRKRDMLGLSPIETLETIKAMCNFCISIVVGCFAMGVVWFLQHNHIYWLSILLIFVLPIRLYQRRIHRQIREITAQQKVFAS